MNTLFIISILFWCLATGLREGTVWNDNWKEVLPIGYHFWRTIEYISVIGMMLTYQNFWLMIGMGMFGLCFIYERALQYIDYGEFWHKQNAWKILKWEIPFTNRFQIIAGLTGLIITIWSLYE